MKKYVIAAIKSWNKENYKKLQDTFPDKLFLLITKQEDLTYEKLKKIKPISIFFIHWSWVISSSIFDNFNCIVFHMTDLPFGRGGSPLQNLIVRGIYKTKISAIKVEQGMDTGDVYFKETLDISTGNANEIFSKASDIIFHKMIPRFINEDLIPMPQQGEVVVFKRRIPEQSEIPDGLSQQQIYDYIRMLDGEGYPTAYRKYNNKKIFYRNARLENNVVYAEAEFRGDEV